MLKVLIVDDFEPDRITLREILSTFSSLNIEIIGECEEGQQALEFVNKYQPDIVVTDIEMPFIDGLGLTRNLNISFPHIKIIFCSLYDDFEYAKKAVSLSSYGYVLKPIDKLELYECIKSASNAIERELIFKEEQLRNKTLLEGSKPLMANKLLREVVLNSDFDSVDFWEKISFLKVNFVKGAYAVIYLEVDKFDKQGNNIVLLDKHILKIDEVISRLKKNLGVDQIIRLDNLHYVIPLSHCEPEGIRAMLTQYATRILEETCNSDLYFTLSTSQIYQEIQELHKGLEQCKKIMDQKFYLGHNQLLSKSMLIAKEDSKFDRKLLQEQIKKLLALQEEEEIKNELYSLVEPLKKELNKKEILHLCFSILLQENRMIQEQNLTDENFLGSESQLWERLNQFETLESTLLWLVSQLQEVIQYLSLPNRTKQSSLVSRIIDFLNNNYSLNIGLNDVSEELALTPNYLNSIFRNSLGVTITDYILSKRLDQARLLLKDQNLKVYEIGNSVGFKNTAYFCSVFKKSTGLTPKQYREKYVQ